MTKIMLIAPAIALLCGGAMAQLPSVQPAALPEPSASGPASAANDRFMAGHYPARALARGEHGAVAFKVGLDRKGKLQTCVVTHSSGYRGLDNETCELIAFYARFKPGLDEDGRAVASTVTGSVSWGKSDAAARDQQVAYTGYRAETDGLICRRTPKTGSNYVKVKECRTAHDWALQYEQMRAATGKIQAGESNSVL
jgi:TonB family protein